MQEFKAVFLDQNNNFRSINWIIWQQCNQYVTNNVRSLIRSENDFIAKQKLVK